MANPDDEFDSTEQPRPSGAASFFFRNVRLTILMAVVLVISAGAALENLARQEDPSLTRRFASLSAVVPGADAERIESTVIEPLEARLREVEGIKEMRSTSRHQFATIFIELKESVDATQTDGVWSKLRDEMRAADLPAGVVPVLDVRSISAASLLVSLRWRGLGPNDPEKTDRTRMLGRIAQELEQRLAAIPKTFRTKIYGAPEEEVMVELNPGLLHRSGLSIDSVSQAVQRFDSRQPAGNFNAGGLSLPVEVGDSYDAVERVGAIPLASTGGGAVLRLDDVAEVRKRVRLPVMREALVHGSPAVVVEAVMEDDYRIDRWRETASSLLDQFEQELPDTVLMEIIYDQNHYTSERLGDLVINLLTAIVLVILVVVFTMGMRSALAVGIALPLTIALVLVEMTWLGIPLHQMSVTGLVISLGLLIDNAIVLNEEYKHKRMEGVPPGDAVAMAATRLWRPLLGSTLTTVFAFMPVALAPGAIGEFTGTMGSMVALSVLSSLFISLTVVLALSAYLERNGNVDYTRHGGYSNERLSEWYERTLVYAMERPWRGIAIGLVLPVLGFLSLTTLDISFFPPTDRNQFQVQLILPRHADADAAREEVLRLRSILAEFPDVKSNHWFVGEPMPRVYYNLMNDFDGQPNYASGFVNTTSAAATKRVIKELDYRLRSEFPESMVLAKPFGQGPPVRVPVEIELYGNDLTVLKSVGEQVRERLSRVGSVTYTMTEMGSSRPKLQAVSSDFTLARSGLGGAPLAQSLALATEGVKVSAVLEGAQELPIRVRLSPLDDSSELASVPLVGRGSTSASSTVDAYADFELVPSTAQILRINSRRLNIIGGHIEPYSFPSDAVAEFNRVRAADPINAPPGYTLNFAGEAAERSDAMGKITSSIPVFLILILTVVVYAMGSFRIAAMVLGTGMLGLGLGFLGLRLGNYPFNYTAVMGSLGLVGVSINDAIVVASGLRDDPRAATGDRDAIRYVVMRQTRHIVSTTLTTICGFLPLIIAGGDFWPPLAVAVAGGVSGATLLALYTIPCLYILLFSKYTSPLERFSKQIHRHIGSARTSGRST